MLEFVRTLTDGFTDPRELVKQGDNLYIADGTEGIVRLNIRTGVTRKKSISDVNCIALFRNTLIVGTDSTDGKVYFYNKSTYAKQGEVSLGSGVKTYGMGIHNIDLYVCCGGTFTGLKIINLLTKRVTSWSMTAPVSVAFFRNYVIVAVPSASNSIRLYDFSRNLQTSGSPVQRCYGLAVNDGFLYATCRYNGVGKLFVYTIPDFNLKTTVSTINNALIPNIDTVLHAGHSIFITHLGSQSIDILNDYQALQTTETESDVIGVGDLVMGAGGDDDNNAGLMSSSGTSDTVNIVPDRTDSYQNLVVENE